jgi:hypothetical protein
MRRRRPELWREQTWLIHHNNAPSYTSVLTQQFLAKQKWLSSPTYRTPLIWHPVTSSYSKKKLKLEGHRFDTTEEIQAESQRVLDTVT